MSIADPGCYACKGTARVIGFGSMHGLECPCVDQCEMCGAQIDWAHDDEPAPKHCETCQRCARGAMTVDLYLEGT